MSPHKNDPIPDTHAEAPLLMVDVVLLTLIDDALQVGLAKRDNPNEPFDGAWCLPGGFVRPQEDMDALDTAKRVLKDKIQVSSPYLEQLATFTGAGRDPRGWSASIAYYALVPERIAPESREGFKWMPVKEVLGRTLAFDHGQIIKAAFERVRSKTSYSTLPVYFMPAEFTMTQLRLVYEGILGEKLDARTFARRIEELSVIDETGALTKDRHRPAKLYRAKSSGAMAHTRQGF